MTRAFRSAAGRTVGAQGGQVATFLVAVVLFCAVAADLTFGGPLTHLDPAVTRWFADHRSGFPTAVFLGLTAMHSTIGIDSMLGVAACGLVWARRWRQALLLVSCVQGAMLLNVLLKLAFARARPDYLRLVELGTFSFPSGHALAATVWWGSVWFTASPWVENGRTRMALAWIGVAVVALTCVSRVYLGAHFLTDVIAGACEGVAWLAAWALLARALPFDASSRTVPPRT